MRLNCRDDDTMAEEAADPWAPNQRDTTTTTTPTSTFEENAENFFEDDFQPFEKLPDSASYLSSLESKLAKLQGKVGPVRTVDLLKGLESAREQHLRDFLADKDYATPYDDDPEAGAEEPEMVDKGNALSSTFMMRKLCPDKQAVSAEELQKLVSSPKPNDDKDN